MNGRLSRSATVYVQEKCLLHQYIRSKDTSNVVERPERLRATNVGVAALVARLEEVLRQDRDSAVESRSNSNSAEEDLTDALERLAIDSTIRYGSPSFPVRIHKSKATLDLLNHAAVKFVHGDIERDIYLESLIKWSEASRDKIATDGTEIPEGLSQGDLYLCPTTVAAIQGALGTVCEAVDEVILASQKAVKDSSSSQPSNKCAFVAIRPPGHHCGENTPSGFCFVNNVVVGAAHAHLKHNVNRAIIFDIDLHHGNGTQSLIWQINEEAYRQRLEESYGAQPGQPGLQVFYGSVHDILSYPCEDGKPELVQAASVSIQGPHGQYVENIHLLPYQSEQQFWEELYEKHYSKLFEKAMVFVEDTTSETAPNDVTVFISCGFDACEHEHESMSRHGRKVPVGFYHRFAKDARAFADKVADGRLISILEGGYSDRALTSGVMAHTAGLLETADEVDTANPAWWNIGSLTTLEKATKKRRGGRASLNANATVPPEPWVQRTLEVFASIDTSAPAAQPVAPPRSMALRERSRGVPAAASSNDIPAVAKVVGNKKGTKAKQKPTITQEMNNNPALFVKSEPKEEPSLLDDGTEVRKMDSPAIKMSPVQKKLPRVVLKLGPSPASAPSTEETPKPPQF